MDGMACASADELLFQWAKIQLLSGAERLVALYEWEDKVWRYIELNGDGSNGSADCAVG